MPSSKAAAQKRGANGGGKLAVGKAVKGAIFGLIVTVLSVLVLAIIKQFGLSDGAIAAVNQAVKVVAIFITAFIATSGAEQNKILTGALAGALYVLFGFGAFSLIEGQWGSFSQLLADLAMGVVIGMLTAMIFSKIFVKQKKPARAAKR